MPIRPDPNLADKDRAPRRPNRLISESSPYLLQHAYNPVDWRPWGAEAFEEARKRDVPILLSVGYSTCYWCHVMERESFENEAIAERMNSGFVCIKLDREERPDVDDAYMAALVAMTGHGGWPMNCFLDPATLKPFWCGTYFPPEAGMGPPGWPQVLQALSRVWREQRADAVAQSQSLAEAVADQAGPAPAAVIGEPQVADTVGVLLRMFDRQNGGFGRAPKFPQPVFLDFLLDVREAADAATRAAIDESLRRTLDRMACGGIFDQVGGGFHRYSVDEFWLVPHFEKMLYDNAQLASTYLRASRALDDGWYGQVARRTLDYVLAEVTAPSGGFFSAQDAEVDHREGLNYLWKPEEFDAVLGDDAPLARRLYGLDASPNFRDPHHPEDEPRYVLRLDERPEALAAALGLTSAELSTKLAGINQALLKARRQRKQPHTDDKVITAWNGLMIAAMARGYAVLRDDRYLQAARAAAAFILTSMRGEDGTLFRISRLGRAKTDAVLEDYAFLAAGLIELERAGGTLPAPLNTRAPSAWARELVQTALKLFRDPHHGLITDAASDADLFVRSRSTHDGAMPSASSVLLHVLIDLDDPAGGHEHRREALELLSSMSGAVAQTPVGATNAVRALFRLLRAAPAEVGAVLGEPADAPPSASSADPAFMPVEIYADAERITVAPGAPAQFRLIVRIAPGYHIIAADPGPAATGLMPFRVGTLGGTGFAAYADYPAGEPYGPGGELTVYTGELEFPVAVELHDQWSGKPLLGVTFQACTDTECLRHVTVELDVAVDRG